MAQTFRGVVVLSGSRGMTSSLRINFADPGGATAVDSYGIVRGWFMGFLDDLKAVTEANILDAYLIDRDPTDYGHDGPYTGAAEVDVKDYAAVSVYINNTPKFATLNIPAPADTLWAAGSNGTQIDNTDAALAAYVANWEENLTLSDGEHVDVTLGAAENGIDGGSWRQVAAKVKRSRA